MNVKYDLLLKEGILVDPINNLAETRNVGIKDGKIISVCEDLKDSEARDVFNIEGA